MSQYYTDFREYEVGQAPHDWEDAWVPGGQRLSIAEAPDATGGKTLRHEVLDHNRRAWSWRRAGGASSVEVAARMRTDSAAARLGVIVRGGGQGVRATEEGVTVELFNGELRDLSEFDQEKQEFRQTLFLDTYDPAREADRGPSRPHGIGRPRGEEYFEWEAGVWYWLRLQARDEDGFIAIRAKAWRGDTEPSDWKYDIQRTEPSTVGHQGWVGITGQRTDGVREYDVFSVGTDGDPAPLTAP